MLNEQTALSKDVAKEVRQLIDLNRESVESFLDAAEDVEDAAIAALYREIADTQRKHIEKLASLLREANDVAAEDENSLSSVVHDIWIELRGTFSSRSEFVVNQSRLAAEYLKDRYDKAIRRCSGTEVSQLLQSQYLELQRKFEALQPN